MADSNQNHPKRGTTIKVGPIKEEKDIKALKKMLSDNPRNLALFTIGINTNLRAGDLTKILVEQVEHLEPMEDIEIREMKTGKSRRVSLNRACVHAIQNFLQKRTIKSKWLFPSRKGDRPLSVPTINNLVKKWCREINLQGNFGAHTLRKTFGYQQRVRFGVGLPELMVAFNHSNQKQTLDYLCVQPEELKSIYENEV